MKLYLSLLLCCFFLTAGLLQGLLQGQKTWNGSTSTSSNNSANWTPAVVPGQNDDVIISNVTRDPIISTGATAKSIIISAGAILTVQSGGTLNLNGSNAEGILNRGSLMNGGIINIGETPGSVGNGLQNESAFTNNWQININRANGTALDNRPNAIFTNSGTINISSVSQPTGYHGIYNYFSATINNNASGIITINNSTGRGIANAGGGTITNLGTLTIGNTASVGEYALYNQGTFNNDACSILSIFAPFYNSSSSFANVGLFRVNTTGAHTNSGFTNNDVVEQVQSNAIPNIGINNDLIIAPVSICGAPSIIQRGSSASFTPAATWYTNPGLTTVAGTYNQNANTFTPNGSHSGLRTFYFSVSNNTNGCPRTVSVVDQFVDNVTTWNGSSSTNWNTASNWTCGVPGPLDFVNIPDVTNDPVIPSGTAAQDKQIDIKSGGQLTVSANGSLTLNGSATESGLLLGNSGTLTSGSLTNSGTVKGTGTLQIAGIFSHSSTGIIAPGASPGKLTVTGILDLQSGTYNCEINGYYRLRQIDLDGKEEFSSIIIVQCTENAAIRLYPNPVHKNLYIGDLTEPTDYIINGLIGVL